MPIGWAAGAAALGGIASSFIGAEGAKSAAQTQADAATQAAQLQLQMFNQTQQTVQPWVTGGGNALAALQSALGLTAPGAPQPAAPGGATPAAPVSTPQGNLVDLGNGYTATTDSMGNTVISGGGQGQQSFPSTPLQQALQQYNQLFQTNLSPITPNPGSTTAGQFSTKSPYAGFQSSPGYQFQLNQGLQSIQNSAAARGGLAGGNTLKALQQYGTGLANQDWYNYLGQLSGLSNTGENAAVNVGNTGAQVGANAGNALIGAGNAQAAGTVGATNAITSGLTGGVNNYLMYSLMNGGGGGGQNFIDSGSF